MKPLHSSRIATVILTVLAVITISSCNNRQRSANESSKTTSQNPIATTQPGSTRPLTQKTQGVVPQGTTCPKDHPIKGVTSKRLGKIALATQSPEYTKAKPDICFSDTATAQQAGYKVP
ncbi:hypothetical protein A6770_18490 [Nostoc minutum NIES-26]|uniref:Uncharacterized protein n=1 Tax=Nostoc minutum NIES-26 TaxID=1844469 RepID=A0A367RBY7_9NOSO|nr:hypothetical protein A6770_18490 [Nostoc minutum NIES-26]